MKRNIIPALVFSLALCVSVCLSGCGSENNSTSQTTESTTAAEEKNEETGTVDSIESKEESSASDTEAAEQTGMIVSIDSDAGQITLTSMGGSQGFMPGQGFGGFSNGEQPSMPEGAGNGEQPSMPEGAGNGEQPSMPEGAGNGQMPNGGQFPGNGPMPESGSTGQSGSDWSGFNGQNFTGSTYSVTDDTVIKDQDGKELRLSELSANCFVSYTEKDGVLLSITLTSFDYNQESNPSGEV